MAENDIQNNFFFEAICFSTNYENCNSISIVKQYFMSTNCTDIKYNNKFRAKMLCVIYSIIKK